MVRINIWEPKKKIDKNGRDEQMKCYCGCNRKVEVLLTLGGKTYPLCAESYRQHIEGNKAAAKMAKNKVKIS